MRKKMLYVILVVALFLGSCLVQADNVKNQNKPYINTSLNDYDAELPEWDIGDYWVYDLFVDLEQSEYFDFAFRLNIQNFRIEVEEVNNIDDQYKLSMNVPQGYITGNGNMNLGGFVFSGQIDNAYLNGEIYVKKSTLEIIKIDGKFEGDTNKILVPEFNIDFSIEFEEIIGDLLEKTEFTVLKFPINTDTSWNVPLRYLNISMNAIKPNLGQAKLMSYIDEHYVECSSWEVIQKDEEEYDALKITGQNYGDTNNIYYAPSIANIVKLDYDNVALGIGYKINTLTMDLIQTNYQVSSNPPETPETPSGLTDFLAGETGTYETKTTDPDNNKIRYIFDWDDETEHTYTDFINSGETITVEHLWGKGGAHNIKVKARDIYGYESQWSNTLTVNVENNKPEKPETPTGTANGKIKTSYPFKTKSTDPDDHKIRYAWDWDGDNNIDETTDLYDSGAEITTSHTFYNKGTYSIKVKAIDEYGEESDWSEPLSVSMPKYKTYGYNLEKIIQILHNYITWLKNILEI